MANIGLVADEGVVFITKEDTEAEYKPEQLSTDAVESLAEGLEFSPQKELLTRSNRTSTVETVSALLGTKSMSGSVPVELKASGVEGNAPETSVLWEALLGGKRSGTATTTETGHTTTSLNVSAPDAAKYAVGDVITIKEAGAFHVSPIKATNTGAGVDGTALTEVLGFGFNLLSTTGITYTLGAHTYAELALMFPNSYTNPTNMTVTNSINAGSTSVSNLGYFETVTGATVQDVVDAINIWFAAQGFTTAGSGPVASVTPSFTGSETYDPEDGSHYMSSDVVPSTGGSIELLVAADTPFSDNVEIAAFTTYFHQADAPTLSITNYLGGDIREKAIGMRPTSAEIGNFSSGQLSDINFSVEGTSFDREVGTPLFTPEFDSDNGVVPPVILCSKVYKGDQEIVVNAVGVTLTNSLAFLTSTASKNGKIASRITKFEVTGSLNPYMETDNVDLFDVFEANSPFSVFAATHNAVATAGEHKDTIGFYVPNARISELGTGVEDGVLTDAISFTGHKSVGNDSFFITFS